MMELSAQVVVIGGGPAGSTAATTLAQRGRDVLLLEKEQFPRYHIGESLLPYGWWTLDRLGVIDKVRAAAFQQKFSVQFVTPDGRLSKPFLFSDHLEHEAAGTWQVERAQFDNLLLENAVEKGVRVMQQTAVTRVIEEGGRVVGVEAVGPDGPMIVRAEVTIDASGRDGVARQQRGWRRPEAALQRFAVWSYYEGFPRGEGIHAGATTVVSVPDDGWFWVIPMQDGKTSVGVVSKADVLFAESRDPAEALLRATRQNPWLVERIDGATQIDKVHVTSDFSYRSAFCADDGLLLVGDAFAFLDPVFSSGVFLALRTGEEGALAVDRALEAGDVSAAAFAGYGEWACAGLEAMRALVYSFYDPKFSMAKLVRAHPQLHGDVTDLLIGNLFRDYQGLMVALDEVGTVPQPLAHGRSKAS